MFVELEEMWLAEILWDREKREQLWEEAQERMEEIRSRAFVASATAGGGADIGPFEGTRKEQLG